ESVIDATAVDYEVLPYASTLKDVMSPAAPDLRMGKGNLIVQSPSSPGYDQAASSVARHGDLERGFAEADVVKEFTYYFAGGVSVPIQPCGGVAKWEGDKLTFWGMGQAIYPSRNSLAKELGIDPEKIRFINKWNGCTLGSAQGTRFNPFVAHIAKMTGRPTKLMLPKDKELAYLTVKPENGAKFEVSARNDRRDV